MDIKKILNFSLLNIDKPSGPTSFKVSQFVRKSLNLSKTAHMGTLDPQVSGVLPVTLGRACRLSEYFMHKNKTYVGVMRLHEQVTPSELKKTIASFIGKITQLPPVRSSVKRAEREREIKTFKILEIKEKNILFETEVQAGTYIRKLIHDMGEKLGGAHMLELRRTKAGIFSEETAITLYEFEKLLKENKLDLVLIPAEEAIKKVLSAIQLYGKNLKQFMDGKPLHKEDIEGELPDEEIFAAFAKEKFIGIYHKFKEGDILAKAEFVFN